MRTGYYTSNTNITTTGKIIVLNLYFYYCPLKTILDMLLKKISVTKNIRLKFFLLFW
jgi:hypothetical protein